MDPHLEICGGGSVFCTLGTLKVEDAAGRSQNTVTTYLRIESEGDTCTEDCGFTTTKCADPLIDTMGSPTVTFDGATVDHTSIPQCSDALE